MSGWTTNTWSRFARQKVERVFTPISPADSALWPLPGYADEETRVHLHLATTTAAAGAAGRRRRPLCDLGTGNFTRPPLPFSYCVVRTPRRPRHGSDTSTPDTVRMPQRPARFGCLNARHGSDTSTPTARRFVRLWTPVSDATCVGTVRMPDTNARHSAAHVRLQAAPVSAYAVRGVCARRSRGTSYLHLHQDDLQSLSKCPIAAPAIAEATIAM